MCHGRAGLALTRSRFRQARTLARKGLDALAALGDGAAHERGRLLLDHAAVFDLTGRHDQSLVRPARRSPSRPAQATGRWRASRTSTSGWPTSR